MSAIFSKIGKLRHGKKQVRLLRAVERRHDLPRQREAFWQDSDNLIRMRVDRDVPAHHLRIGRVAARPYAITQNYDVRAAVAIVLWSKEPALCWSRAQHRQQVTGNAH